MIKLNRFESQYIEPPEKNSQIFSSKFHVEYDSHNKDFRDQLLNKEFTCIPNTEHLEDKLYK